MGVSRARDLESGRAFIRFVRRGVHTIRGWGLFHGWRGRREQACRGSGTRRKHWLVAPTFEFLFLVGKVKLNPAPWLGEREEEGGENPPPHTHTHTHTFLPLPTTAPIAPERHATDTPVSPGSALQGRARGVRCPTGGGRRYVIGTKEVHKEEGKKKGGAIALKFGQPKRAGWAHAGDERALGIPGRAAATLRCTANP